MFKFLLSIIWFGFVSSATDYCDPNLCSDGMVHIACNNTGTFSSTCPADRKMVQMTVNQMQYIVSAHNFLRNKIASGAQEGFSSAHRMATMTWSNELAQLAALNVKTCELAHDSCRNTYEFRRSGQNLAYRSVSPTPEAFEVYIDKVVAGGWYNEYKNAQQSDIDNCCNSASGQVIGHFTLMVTDRAIKIGCALSRFTVNNMIRTLIACNYAFTNLYGSPVYVSGAPASGCTLGPNPDYPALCNVSEPIQPI